MKYDLKNSIDLNQYKMDVEKHIRLESKVEMKKIIKKRTVTQNSYLHVCIALFAIEFGYTLNEAKTLLKRECEFMRYKKKGVVFLIRTSDLDTKQMTSFIDWIRNHSSKQGCYIPKSEEYLTNKYNIDRDIDRHKTYI